MWWAVQVANNKEYDTKREILSLKILTDDEVFIPRIQNYIMKEEALKKKTDKMIPGYIFLKLGEKPKINKLASLNSYLKILGKVTEEEMVVIEDHENIPESLDIDSGDKIIVTRGPFTGVKGYITRETVNGNYLCRLVFHGNEIEVQLDSKIIEKIN